MRLVHAGLDKHFIVDGEMVYADNDGDGKIAKSDRYKGPAEAELVAAARHFDVYYDAPFPGAKSLDPQIISGGRLNAKEAAQFSGDPRGVLAKRPDLMGHLDFFDRRDADGMITLRESYRSWRDLGYGPVKSLVLTAGAGLVFGRLADGFGIDIGRIGEKRLTGTTRIYGPDGNVDHARLAELAAVFDERSTNGVLTHDELRTSLAEKAQLGRVPRRQFETLLMLTGRLNGSRTVTKAQFLGLFDNSLFWTAVSIPDKTGRRKL
jgi:hypothetical protein